MTKDLVYYYVPEEKRNYKNVNALRGLMDSFDTTELVVVDNNGNKVHNRLFYAELDFAEQVNSQSQLIWELKDKVEALYIADEEKKSVFESVDSIPQLKEAIRRFRDSFGHFYIVYERDGNITKMVINSGESISIVVKRNDVNFVEGILSNWAEKETFKKHEWGENE